MTIQISKTSYLFTLKLHEKVPLKNFGLDKFWGYKKIITGGGEVLIFNGGLEIFQKRRAWGDPKKNMCTTVEHPFHRTIAKLGGNKCFHETSMSFFYVHIGNDSCNGM